MTTFALSVRFLDARCHGRGDGGMPEWPPSPLRAFQALVAAGAARWNERERLESAAPALRWLERLPPPVIVAAAGVPSENPHRLYVPDNIADKVAGPWSRGNEASIADYRTEKDVRPTHLKGEAVHYLWDVPDGVAEFDGFARTLRAAARSITHVGWGVDQVAADARALTAAEAGALEGGRWRPGDGGRPLRVPVAGTLADLSRKHTAFLGRLDGGTLRPVPPLAAFRAVGYRRATDPAPRPFAAFALLTPDADGFRPFDAVRHGPTVAGMVRHAAATAARSAGWPPERIDSFIQGHGAGRDEPARTDERLMFLPLPSITPLRVESVRRVLVVGPPGGRAEVDALRRLLGGAELVDQEGGEVRAMLSVIPSSDRNVLKYADAERPARAWSTVTPVILPGFDDPDGLRKKLRGRDRIEAARPLLDRLDRRIRELLRKAFLQAGYAGDLVDRAECEYREVGFRPGLDLAANYRLPPVDFPRYHVRVVFPEPVAGPLAVGAGRYRGLGLFARE